MCGTLGGGAPEGHAIWPPITHSAHTFLLLFSLLQLVVARSPLLFTATVDGLIVAYTGEDLPCVSSNMGKLKVV